MSKSIKLCTVFIILLYSQAQAAIVKEVVYTISVTIPAVVGMNTTSKDINRFKEEPTSISPADIQIEETHRGNQSIILKTITSK